MRFQGKSVIVTGGASGIGKATANQFASDGASVVIADVNPEGQAVAQQIGQETQKEVSFVQADVSKAEDANRLIQEVLHRHGQLDILHNNAGILVVGDVTTIPEADWDRCIDINLKSVYLVSRYAIPAMQQTNGGVIINTASTAGISGGGGYSVYGASKAAIILLTQCMALDFAKHNIRVNAVCPGPTATPMILSPDTDRESALERWAQELPIGRAGEPIDTAKAVAYLASDDASFVTGSAFVVDGGRLLTGIGQRIAVDV
jgi:NAD(P)-dependent dehydrogenase (short-subunit alcohol dehydrogenase family)